MNKVIPVDFTHSKEVVSTSFSQAITLEGKVDHEAISFAKNEQQSVKLDWFKKSIGPLSLTIKIK